MMVSRTHSRQGSILILVLWVLFFLASLTVASAGHVLAVLRAAERLQYRVHARMEAWSAAAWAVSVMEAQQGETALMTNVWDGVSADAWNRDAASFALPAEFGGQTAYVSFAFPGETSRLAGVVGEEGRIHLNAAPPALLQALFGYVGGEPGALLAETLFQPGVDDGLTPDAQDEYDRKSYASVGGLRLEEAMSADLYAALEPHVTVYGQGDWINFNAATETVLVAVLIAAGREPAVAEQIARVIVEERAQTGFSSRANFEERVEGIEPGFSVQHGLAAYSTAFRGIAAGGGEEAAAGIGFAFVWDTRAGQYVLWREQVGKAE